MYTLFWSPGAASLAPHFCLEEAGIAYAAKRVDMSADQHKQAAYLAINPQGKIPALITDNGAILTEAAAISLHIADRHPEAKLMPALGSLARAEAYMWLIHLTNTLQPAMLRYYYTDRVSADPAHAEAIKAAAAEEILRLWARIDAHLAKAGPYLAGGVFTAADAFGFMLSKWQECCPGLYARFPGIAKFAETVGARPAISRILALNEMS